MKPYFFPLYSSQSQKERKLFEPSHNWKGRHPNFTDEFTEFIAKQFEDIPSPQTIFYYIYAILCSTYYRTKFNDLLRIDFPKIPFISDKRKFDKISDLGQRLADIQLRHALQRINHSSSWILSIHFELSQ